MLGLRSPRAAGPVGRFEGAVVQAFEEGVHDGQGTGRASLLSLYRSNMSPSSMLVTGASTGIGKATALYMDERGWKVFAGVRKESDGEALEAEASGSLEPIIVDVTDTASIASAAKEVEGRVDGLDGLVNNAGISVHGPLEYLPLDDLRNQLEVNVIGQVAVTQAFLPLIRQAKGSVVFVGSVAGRAPSLPMLGPYTASKYAIEALGESLRLELLPWDIKVSIIEPGAIESAIWEKGTSAIDDLLERIPEEGRDRYLDSMNRAREIAQWLESRGIGPEKVARKVHHALTASNPRIHYLVGMDAKSRAFLESQVPKPLRDKVVSKVLGYDKKGT